MRIRFSLLLLLLLSKFAIAQKQYQLAPPVVYDDGRFFAKATRISFEFRQAGSEIRYTLDGSEPTTQSNLYTGPIDIQKHLTTVKAKVFAAGFLPSETVTSVFYGAGIPIRLLAASDPHPRYAGRGPQSLNDLQTGGINHNSTAWWGYQTDSVLIRIELQEPAILNQLLVHTLNSQDAWIFLPARINVYAQTATGEMLVGQQSIDAASKSATKDTALLVPLAVPNAISRLRVVLYPLQSIPAWHPGKGSQAWCFIDEIKIY